MSKKSTWLVKFEAEVLADSTVEAAKKVFGFGPSIFDRVQKLRKLGFIKIEKEGES